MVNATRVRSDFHKVMEKDGQQIAVTTYNIYHPPDDYDDVEIATGSTTVWTSGIIQPISFNNKSNVSESKVRLQQGLISTQDKILYIESGTSIDETTCSKIEIGVGSPISDKYSLLPEGVLPPFNINGEWVYQKAYMRILNTNRII